LQNLNIIADVNVATTSLDELKAFVETATKWKTPFDLDHSKREFEKLLSKYKEARSEIENHRESIQEVSDEAEQNKLDGRKTWYRMRNKVQGFLADDHNVCAALARPGADLLYATAVKPGTAKVEWTYASETFSKGSFPVDELFSCPRYLQGPTFGGDGKDINHWAGELEQLRSQNVGIIDTRVGECLADIQEKGSQFSYGTVELQTEFKWNPELSTAFNAVTVRTMVFVKEIYCANISVNAFPIIGHPHFLGVIRGRALVVVAPPEVVSKHLDLHAFVQDAGSTAFAKFHAYILGPGESVWCPFGYCPLVLGISDSVDFTQENPKLAQRGAGGRKLSAPKPEYVVFFAQPLYDRARDARMDKAHRLAVASLWPKAIQFLPKDSLLKNPEIQAWKTALEMTD